MRTARTRLRINALKEAALKVDSVTTLGQRTVRCSALSKVKAAGCPNDSSRTENLLESPVICLLQVVQRGGPTGQHDRNLSGRLD
jgi:hypothetical protein